MAASSSLVNLRGDPISLSDEDWYNLHTQKRTKRTLKGIILLSSPRIAGTPEEIKQFFKMNRLPSISLDKLKEKLKPEDDVHLLPNVFELLSLIFESYFTEVFSPFKQPNSNLLGIKLRNSLGISFPLLSEITDIERLPLELTEKVGNFKLSGLRTKAKITRVIDGDTIDIMFFLPFEYLSKNQTIIYSGHGTGMIVSFRSRLNGIDAAEKNTSQGVLAKKLMEEEYAKTKNIVFVDLFEFDKYGRLLIEIYRDEKREENLNRCLLGVKTEIGIVVEPYNGGTKSKYMKEL